MKNGLLRNGSRRFGTSSVLGNGEKLEPGKCGDSHFHKPIGDENEVADTTLSLAFSLSGGSHFHKLIGNENEAVETMLSLAFSLRGDFCSQL